MPTFERVMAAITALAIVAAVGMHFKSLFATDWASWQLSGTF